MKTFPRWLAPFLFSVSLMPAALAGVDPVKPSAPVAVPAKPTPSARAEKLVATDAPADFPYNFQSLFGRGDKTMASLREKGSGKSLWVSTGEKVGDYTLESIDSAHGVAVFLRKGVRYRLRLSLSSNESLAVTPETPVAKVDPVQNKAKEKVLLNDARQLSSALNQYFSENAVTEAPIGKIRMWFSGNTLSQGTQIVIGSGVGARVVDFSDKSIDSTVLRAGERFELRTEGYDRSASENRKIMPEGKRAVDTPGGVNGISFSVNSGSPDE